MAALTLFDEQGYQATTVAEIAERAGLTPRTFFRYFADKREVLFNGSAVLEEVWLDAMRDAAPEATPMEVVVAGFAPVAEIFAERHGFARIRARIVATTPELEERELMKLQNLARAIEGELRRRGVRAPLAALAAQAGLTVFHVAFTRWVQHDDPSTLRRLMNVTLVELREVTSA